MTIAKLLYNYGCLYKTLGNRGHLMLFMRHKSNERTRKENPNNELTYCTTREIKD